MVEALIYVLAAIVFAYISIEDARTLHIPVVPLWVMTAVVFIIHCLSGAVWFAATGYVAGAALTLLVRTIGSWAAGEEAMGMGDVHLLAAVGCCFGAKIAVFSFFFGNILGLVYWVFYRKRRVPMIPAFSVAALLSVFICEPVLKVLMQR